MTFTPLISDLQLTVGIAFLTVVGMLYLALRWSRGKHPDPRRRVLLPMLAYFGALIGLLALMGAGWTILKYPELRVTDRRMYIDGEEYRLPAPDRIGFQGPAARGPRLLVVQTDDRRMWVFPGDRYPVNEMFTAVKEARKQ